ncbi:MAG TPA: pyridoxal-phosphate dependent enzyme [Thermoplasmata archaeon]|nr:pyridoxal-phosphate dependent enzyme [Thermoplasmata archaeon]
MDRIEVKPRDVEGALTVVREVAIHTPLLPVTDGDARAFLKLENLQRLGAFKIRGVWNRLTRLPEEDRRRGVATISSGNHGLALAWASKRLGFPCVVHVPVGGNPRKVEGIRAHGAEVRTLSRPELVRTYEDESWRSWPETFIHPFAHAHTIAGQGTAGWEIVDDLPDVRTVLVPVGGGGLATGIALGIRGRVPGVKVFGVQADGAAPLPEALRTGRPSRIEAPRTIADGIGVGMIVESMVDLLRRNLDGCLLISEEDLLDAMRTLLLEAKVVAEPAGAAAFAAWKRYRDRLEAPVVAVISGGNVDPAVLARVTASP